jgi:ABC-2 type transport system ATP-binding protein
MSEMALTADHLIIVGRGRLVEDISVRDLVQRSSKNRVLVRTPNVAELTKLLGNPDVTITPLANGGVDVVGLTAAQIGDAAAAARIALHELTPHEASLEEAFMELTRGDLEFVADGPRTTQEAAA